MIKRLLIAVSALSLVAGAASAHPQGGWNGGYYHGPRQVYVAPILGAIVGNLAYDALTNTHVVCNYWQVGYQVVQRCFRVANQPAPVAIVVQPAQSTVSPECQDAVDRAVVDDIKQYCS